METDAIGIMLLVLGVIGVGMSLYGWVRLRRALRRQDAIYRSMTAQQMDIYMDGDHSLEGRGE